MSARRFPAKRQFFWHNASRRVLLFVLLLLIFSASLTAVRAQQQNTDVADELLKLLNEWRVQEGLWPLKVNSTLETMAVDQAVYILPRLASIEDYADYHLDAQGRDPRQRAPQAPYNWPTYRRAIEIEIGENAAIGTPLFAVNFWKGSDIHRRAVLSRVFREVGIAAVPYQRSYLFIVVFGARPGVLTALASPSGDVLYLSGEFSRFARLPSGNLQIRLFNADGQAITETMPWQAAIPLPSNSVGTLYVLYTLGEIQTLHRVSLGSDVAVLPRGSQAAALPASSTPFPTVVVATAPPATVAPVSPTSSASLPEPTRPTQEADLALIYNSRSLILLNNAGRAVNLTGLWVGTSASRITAESWLALAPFPIAAFPAGHCLQARLLGTFDPAPSQCRFVRSQIDLTASRVFWTQGTFTVNRGDTVLATCAAGANRCEVDLP